MRLPTEDFSLLEPQPDLLLSIFYRIRPMANISSNFDAKVSTDSPWL
jgi:hypothetical protein